MLVTTPTGQQIVVPDNLAGFMPGGGLDAGGGVPPAPPPMQQFGYTGGPPPANPLVGAPPPPKPDSSAAPFDYLAPPPDLGPEPATPPANAFPAPDAVLRGRGDKGQLAKDKAAQKQQAQQQAYQASPEGQIATGEKAALGAVNEQRQVALSAGDLAAKEAEDVQTMRTAGEGSADYWQARSDEQNQRNRAAIAVKTKAIEDAVSAEANYKIDDNRLWHNMGTGNKILAGISVAMSGLGDAMAGRADRPNMALAIITGAIKDDVDAQIREREHLGKRIGIARNSLDNYRQVSADDREAGQLKVAEMYKRTARKMESAAGAYGSERAKLAAQQTAAQLDAEAAKIIGQYGESAFNRDVQRQNLANQKAQIGVAYGNLDLNRKQFAWQKDYQRDQLMLEAGKLAQAGKANEAKLYMERGIGGTTVPVTDENGNVTGVRHEPLKNRDGSVWIPTGGEASVDKLRNVKAASETLIGIIDEVQRMGPEYLSDTANSKKLQEMKANWAAAKLEVKDVKQLGVLAGPDMDLIDQYLGTPDPTRWKDSVAGIAQARKNIVRGTNTLMQAHGLDGEWAPPDLGGLAKPADDEGTRSFEELKGSDYGKGLHERRGDYSVGSIVKKIAGAGAGTSSVSAVGDVVGDIGKAGDIHKKLDAMLVMAGSKNNQVRDTGLSRLRTLANEGTSDTIRKLATEYLNRANGAIPIPTGAEERVRP